jgi:bacterioferritin-associated ferredoxin
LQELSKEYYKTTKTLAELIGCGGCCGHSQYSHHKLKKLNSKLD